MDSMKVTDKELRRIIREELSSSYVAPVSGLAGLMQEFDVPVQSRKKISQTVQSVFRNDGGPLDASYEVEKSLRLDNLPEDFYVQAFDLVKKESQNPHQLDEGFFDVLKSIGAGLAKAFSVAVDFSKARKPKKDLDPKGNLEDQIWALSTTLQLTGYAIESMEQLLDFALKDGEKLDPGNPENYKRDMQRILSNAAKAYGSFREWLTGGALKQYSKKIASVGEKLPDKPSDIFEAFGDLKKAVEKLDSFNIDGEAKKILKQKGAEKAAKKTNSIPYLEQGMKDVKRIPAALEKIRKLEEILKKIKELGDAEGEAPTASSLVGEAVLRNYVKSIITETEE